MAQSGRGIWLWEERISELESIGRRQPHISDNQAVALIGVEKVIRRVVLHPEQKRRMLPIALFEKREGLLAVAELSIKEGQINGRDILRRGFLFEVAHLPADHVLVSVQLGRES